MEQYISKPVLVAEIGRLIDSHKPLKTLDPTYCEGLNDSLDDILLFIDTLEVKEVDLEKELIKWHKEHFKKDGTFIGMSGFYLTNNSQVDIAKHFFELGMQVSNKAQKGE